jgi:hypothetical protein
MSAAGASLNTTRLGEVPPLDSATRSIGSNCRCSGPPTFAQACQQERELRLAISLPAHYLYVAELNAV